LIVGCDFDDTNGTQRRKDCPLVELPDNGDLIEREEPEINPCRGCDDYDGRGGCKSHGGCGTESCEEDENWYTELDDEKIAERDKE
jgi:hypothetical protein